MSYAVEFAPRAARQFRKLPARARRRLAPHIDALAHNPRPPGVKKLQGADNVYRLRIGDDRLVYELRDRARRVLVLAVGSRRSIYRALARK